jgi:hypothetical protein
MSIEDRTRGWMEVVAPYSTWSTKSLGARNLRCNRRRLFLLTPELEHGGVLDAKKRRNDVTRFLRLVTTSRARERVMG